MNLLKTLTYLIYFSGIAIIAGAFLPWLEGVGGSAMSEEIINQNTYLIKRISVGVMAAVALVANYNSTRAYSSSQKRKLLFLQIIIGILEMDQPAH